MTSACFVVNRREAHALRLRDAVLAPQMAVGFHCQRAAVFMSEPARNSRNIHAAFDAARREQMPQVVMRDAIRADFLARAIKRLLAFANSEYFRVQRFARRVRCAFVQTMRAHRESVARGAPSNSLWPFRGRRAQRFRQHQSPHRAM